MGWSLRPRTDVDIFKPYECPEYLGWLLSFDVVSVRTNYDDFYAKLVFAFTVPELFTIKLMYDGEMLNEPKRYVGGLLVYVDFCDNDEISLLEINTMLVECGAKGGYYNLWYKLPGTTMENGLFELESDDDLMVMCTLLPKSRYVEIFVIGIAPIDVVDERRHVQEEIHMENPFPDSTQQEQLLEEEVREMEGIHKDFSDEDYVEEDSDDEDYEEGEDDVSFHSDESNKDDEDDDLLFDLHADRNLYDNYEDEDVERDVNHNEESDESSVYAASDEERMASNSTDEDEKSYPVFNEDVDMAKPVFELGMMFRSSGLFRKAVKTHAILERRPIGF